MQEVVNDGHGVNADDVRQYGTEEKKAATVATIGSTAGIKAWTYPPTANAMAGGAKTNSMRQLMPLR